MTHLALALRWAWRDLRGGFPGLRLFIAALAIGVAAIAAAGSTAEAFRAGLAHDARQILGGDIAVSVSDRPFTAMERRAIAARGRTSFAAAVEAMATGPAGQRALVELRGVGGDYPLVGHVELAGGDALAEALRPERGRDGRLTQGVAVEASLLRHLDLRLGQRFEVGAIPVVARAVLLSEPDRLSRGFALGPRVLAPLATVEGAGLVGAGLPFGETARILLPPGEAIGPAKAALKRALRAGPGSGLRLRDARNATPAIGRGLDRLEYFLGLIGLASLLAGGLGVRGAVIALIDRRARAIGAARALGASGALVRDQHLVELAAVTALGVVIGLAIGAAVPPLIGAALARAFPDLRAPSLVALYPQPLLRASAFGCLTALTFALPPLAAIRRTPPSALLRGEAPRAPGLSIETTLALLAGAGLIALAVRVAPDRSAAAIAIGSVILAFGLLWLLGWGLAVALGGARRWARGPARLGLAQLAGRPAVARDTAAALGLGVALLSAVILIQSGLIAEVRTAAPKTAPSVVFTGIPEAKAAAFDDLVAEALGHPPSDAEYQRFPYLTGRLVAARGRPVDRERIAPPDRWAWDSDISLTTLGTAPPDARLVAGRWWPAIWRGPPQAVLSLDAARGEEVKVGDTVTVSALGAIIEARVAGLRRIDIAGFGPDVPVVLDPHALAGAHLDQVAIARASPAAVARISQALGQTLPMVGVIDVRAALASVAELFDRLGLAIRAAASVALVAGVLVLVGTVAAGAGARARESAVLQALGASRAQVLGVYLVEFAAVGLMAGLAGAGLGALAAWPVLAGVFQIGWSFDGRGAAPLAGLAAAGAGVAGLAAGLLALRRPPAGRLRAEA